MRIVSLLSFLPYLRFTDSFCRPPPRTSRSPAPYFLVGISPGMHRRRCPPCPFAPQAGLLDGIASPFRYSLSPRTAVRILAPFLSRRRNPSLGLFGVLLHLSFPHFAQDSSSPRENLQPFAPTRLASILPYFWFPHFETVRQPLHAPHTPFFFPTLINH